MPRCIVFCILFFERCLVCVCSQLGLVGSQITWFFLWKISSYETSPFEVIIGFWSRSGLNFASLLHPKSTKQISKNRSQEALKHWSVLGSSFTWISLRFRGKVGATLATFLGPRPPERPSRPLHDAFKTPARRSKMLPKTRWIAKGGSRCPQTCPAALQTSVFCDCWSIVGPCVICGWFFDPSFIAFTSSVSTSTQIKNSVVAGRQLCCALDICRCTCWCVYIY